MTASVYCHGGTGFRRVTLTAGFLFCLTLWLSGCAIHPKPLTTDEITARAEKDLGSMFQDQEPMDEPVDLFAAMARAVKYNLDYRLQLMEKVLSKRTWTSPATTCFPSLRPRRATTTAASITARAASP